MTLTDYLVKTAREIKKAVGILAKPAPKKKKNYHPGNYSSGNKLLWRWRRKMPGKKDYVWVWLKEYGNKND